MFKQNDIVTLKRDTAAVIEGATHILKQGQSGRVSRIYLDVAKQRATVRWAAGIGDFDAAHLASIAIRSSSDTPLFNDDLLPQPLQTDDLGKGSWVQFLRHCYTAQPGETGEIVARSGGVLTIHCPLSGSFRMGVEAVRRQKPFRVIEYGRKGRFKAGDQVTTAHDGRGSVVRSTLDQVTVFLNHKPQYGTRVRNYDINSVTLFQPAIPTIGMKKRKKPTRSSFVAGTVPHEGDQVTAERYTVMPEGGIAAGHVGEVVSADPSSGRCMVKWSNSGKTTTVKFDQFKDGSFSIVRSTKRSTQRVIPTGFPFRIKDEVVFRADYKGRDGFVPKGTRGVIEAVGSWGCDVVLESDPFGEAVEVRYSDAGRILEKALFDPQAHPAAASDHLMMSGNTAWTGATHVKTVWEAK